MKLSEDLKQWLKLIAIGGAALALYFWLESQRQQQLAAANAAAANTGTSGIGDASAAPAPNPTNPGPNAGGAGQQAPALSGPQQQLAAALAHAAQASPVIGRDLATVDQWNCLLATLAPDAQTSNRGTVPGANDLVTAAEYVARRAQYGMRLQGAQQTDYVNSPYGWVN